MRTMSRRLLLGAAALLPAPPRAGPAWAGTPGISPASLSASGVPQPGAAPGPALLAGWAQFRRDFLLPEGRVIDTGNRQVSHSEGQGWALFCAERAGDRAGFELIWNWTRRVLARPQDRLLAWRYLPDQPADPVPDRNNATDGDLFAAAALLLAGQRWGQAAYAEAGAAIARDVLRLLLRQVAGQTVLLPGLRGFESAERVVLNPSYYAFPILGVLARGVPDPAWLALAADGLLLLRRARFGRWGLPPDWLQMERADGALSLPAQWPPRFSYDAIRVPFYLCWAGLAAEPAAQAAARFWAEAGPPPGPAWVDLQSDRPGPYAAAPGLRALAAWVQRRATGRTPESPLLTNPRDDYYASVLKLLLAVAEP
ncbi:glycosyl hydrolase family 8 [Pseudoroseomonas cervicalis]|uniref:glycosyl hydrolase family 8 n=1 Tax=Teichococcus cervicalis TaxID=204525 RepID=UPI0027897E7B|nr:glycosyl hydrolase family 8 [Pseudoroseomonas cervicalis]MDQ1081650.1 endo-1,4-beta-D-glucanase Y [Pseudoroseomonas cervicalis]